MLLKPIGVVRNEVKEPRKVEWEGIISEIEIREDLEEALDGIEGFSHIIVLFWFHLAPSEFPIKVHPRGRQDLPLIGILVSRYSARPNPIGLSVVRLLERKGRVLRVQGLDACDGTPVIDIKPFIPGYDSPHQATTPDWEKKLRDEYP